MASSRPSSATQAKERDRGHNINLQALEVFCEVVRLRSFSRGAQACGVSQSAASQLVAHLEEEIDAQLIDRKRRPLALTPEGSVYYQGCQAILDRHRSLLDEVRRSREALSGTVRVASIYSVGLHTLNTYLQRFMAQYVGTRVYLEYFHPTRVYAAVLNDEVDLGVVSYPRPHRNLDVLEWLQEDMVVACPPVHRLAGRKAMRLRDLHGYRFVAFDRELKIRREIDRVLRQHQVQIDIVSEFDNIETIKQALEVSSAVSILPRPSIQREVERGTLVEVPMDDVRMMRPVGIISRRRRKKNRATEQFVATLLDSGGGMGL